MSHFTVMVIGENPEQQLAPFQENNMGDCPKEYLKFNELDYKDEGYDSIEEMADDGYEIHNGKIGYWENPNAKWDWWQLGGRWTGLIKLKENACGNIGDPGLMTPRAKPRTCDQALKKDIENIDDLTTFAIIKDGKWYERGEMGWWATVSNEKDPDQWKNEQQKLIKELPEDTLISIYDCHI